MRKANASDIVGELYDEKFLGTKLERFVNIFNVVDTDRMEALILSFIKGESWLKKFIIVERDDQNWTPFLKNILEKSSGNTATQATATLSNIAQQILRKNRIDEGDIYILSEILGVVIFLRWGLKEHILNTILGSRGDIPDALREKAGVALALYPMDDNRKRFWADEARDYRKNSFLIYPLFLAFQAQDYLDLFHLLRDAETKPVIHNSFLSRILDIIEKIEDDLNKNPQSFARILESIVELPKWLRELLEHSQQISFRLKSLNVIIKIFDKYKYKYAKNRITKEFYFPEIPIYDLSILDYILHSKISEEFGVTLKALKIRTENLDLSETIHDDTEMDFQNLLRPEFCRKNNIPHVKVGNLLLVMPRQLINNTNKASGIDLAICNLFRHSFILNTSLDELFKEDDRFRRSELPIQTRNWRNSLVNRLFVVWKKGYRLAAYDKKGEEAIRALYEYLGNHYPGFGSGVRLDIYSSGGRTIQQKQLIHLLDDPRSSPALIVCTAPVLAYGLAKDHTYLFHLDDIREELKNHLSSDEDDLRKTVDGCFIHTSLNINVSSDKFKKMSKAQKADLVRLASMILYTAGKISRDPNEFIQFIFNNPKFNPMNGKEREIPVYAIASAVRTSYIYSTPKYYKDFFYSQEASFKLTHGSHSNNFSDVLYNDAQDKFDALLKKIGESKDEVSRLLGIDSKKHINLIHDEIIKLLWKEKLTIDFYGKAANIAKDVDEFLKRVAKSEEDNKNNAAFSDVRHSKMRYSN